MEVPQVNCWLEVFSPEPRGSLRTWKPLEQPLVVKSRIYLQSLLCIYELFSKIFILVLLR